MMQFFRFVAIISMAMLGGCAAPLIATQEKDLVAKEFVPPKDKSSVYIYRNEILGGGYGMPVTVNGRSIGETGAMTYFRLNVPAGNYTIGSHAENYSDTQLSTEVGKNYFVWQEAKIGVFKPRSELKQVDEKTGKAGVLESKLITSLLSDDVLSNQNDISTIKLNSNSSAENGSASQKLKDLQTMLKEKLITEDDYNRKKQKILDGM